MLQEPTSTPYPNQLTLGARLAGLQGAPVIRQRGQPGHRRWGLTAVLVAIGFLAGTVIAAAMPMIGLDAASRPGVGGETALQKGAGADRDFADATGASALFDSFDLDSDGQLMVSEAAAFYDWVEKEITYRYDDENVAAPIAGYEVGDGRPGPDYQQTPEETLAERKGDCEDMNALELAFYTHWNVPAYLAYVNARVDGVVDHAVTLVRGASTVEEFREVMGNAMYYESRGRPGIDDGVYFVVDNAYSDEFAAISGGIEPGKFVVHRTVSHTVLFGLNWSPASV